MSFNQRFEFNDIFEQNKQIRHDPFRGVGRSDVVSTQRDAGFSPQGNYGLVKPMQSYSKQTQNTQAPTYPPAHLPSMMNCVNIISSPTDTLNDCAQFLDELDMKNFDLDLQTGNIKGYFFQDAKNVKFSLQIRGSEDADLFLDATRMTGDAFVFVDFWKALSTYLGEHGHTEEEVQNEEDSFDFMDLDLEFTDDEDMDMDMQDTKFLKFDECSETLKFMIDDMKDPNFRETCASTLAFNCEDNSNKQVMMQYGQELFDALIACIFCSMATCYFAQLPFYRSAAQLLDAVFDNQAVQMVSDEQYETLVAATKNWAVESRHYQGEITCSEEIATILSKQLARCAPTILSQRAQNDLNELQKSPFRSVKRNAIAALALVK